MMWQRACSGGHAAAMLRREVMLRDATLRAITHAFGEKCLRFAAQAAASPR
jgi:hypothetical protein